MILKNNYETEVKAHQLDKESLDLAIWNETDLKRELIHCQSAYDAVSLALKVEQGKPKVVQVINTGWKWYEITGLAIIVSGLSILGGHFLWQK